MNAYIFSDELNLWASLHDLQEIVNPSLEQDLENASQLQVRVFKER